MIQKVQHVRHAESRLRPTGLLALGDLPDKGRSESHVHPVLRRPVNRPIDCPHGDLRGVKESRGDNLNQRFVQLTDYGRDGEINRAVGKHHQLHVLWFWLETDLGFHHPALPSAVLARVEHRRERR